MISLLRKIQKKEQIQIAVTGALVLILVFLLWNNSQKQKSKFTAESNGQLQNFTSMENEQPGLTQFAKWDQEAKKITLKRDPFFPVKEEAVSGFFLNGIVWDEQKPTVMINNEIYATGDTVNGFTVLEIKKSNVVLSDGKSTLELKLEENK